MNRIARYGWVLLVVLAGCTRDQDYLDVVTEQQAAWSGFADILETVKDEQSMKEAKAALETKAEQIDAVVKKAQALPKPPPDILDKQQHKIFLWQRAIDRARDEVRRVRALPGGEAFCKQFGSKGQGLMSAVQP